MTEMVFSGGRSQGGMGEEDGHTCALRNGAVFAQLLGGRTEGLAHHETVFSKGWWSLTSDGDGDGIGYCQDMASRGTTSCEKEVAPLPFTFCVF